MWENQTSLNNNSNNDRIIFKKNLLIGIALLANKLSMELFYWYFFPFVRKFWKVHKQGS